jgi:signal transduction histidine kinase
MAHDLNNLLTPVLMAAQLLQRRLQDKKSQELLQILETNTKRGAALVQQVLTFASGVEGRHALLQINTLLTDISSMLCYTFPANIQVEFQSPQADLWPIIADVTQIHQVMMNLCLNARDAMVDGGVLRIEAINFWVDRTTPQRPEHQPEGPYVVIKVIDTGTGILPMVQERMFDPFYTTKGVGEGTGLGLAMVIGIINSHQGFLTVDTQMGQGSTFTIYLPAQVSPTAKSSA